MLALVSCMASACSTFVAYSGPELPDPEVATVECYSRYYFVYLESCSVTAIDGRRPGLSQLFSNTSKVTPGRHWLEIAFERYFGGGGGVTDVCAFDLDVNAGHVYRISAHSLKTDIGLLAKHSSPSFYSGSLDLGVTSPAEARETHQIKVTCSFGGGSMCRQISDCSPHPDMQCIPQEGHSFGRCGFETR